MKASDVVNQLAVLLPQLTDKLTRNTSVLSLSRSGTTITAACADQHGLKVGDAVAITGATTQIAVSSLTRSGTVGTLVTSTDHDLTNDVASTITISGAVEAEFNGSFTLVNVDSRKTIRFAMTDAGATTATGSPILEDGESALRQYDGTYRVDSVPTGETFTFQNASTTLADPAPTATIEARAKPRISAGVNPERILDAYTKQEVGDLWLFAVLDPVSASKSRNTRSDAIDNLVSGSEYRQQILQGVTLYLFIPAQEQIAAASARDLAEDLFRPVCRSMLGSKFSSGLYADKLGPVHFVGHSVASYDASVYVHAYSFQQTVDLYFEDTVGPDLDVALRNIDFDSATRVDGGTAGGPFLTADINLDDVPE